MNSLPYFPLSITRTHPLLFPLSAHVKRGNLLKYNAFTPFFATAEKGSRPDSYRELSGGGDEYMQPEKMVNCTTRYIIISNREAFD